jgi:FKBP-type peptidyl-prolyl cis-trans isomerase FklB
MEVIMIRVAAILLLALSACHESGGSPPRDDTKVDHPVGNDTQDRESYSLGYELGTSLKNQNAAAHLEAYIIGLREAAAGTPPQVSQDELRKAVAGLRQKAIAAQKAGLQEKADKNRADGMAFLEKNKHQDGVEVLPSGLQYKRLKDGTGKKPTATSTVVVHYRSSLVDGTEFANSYKQKTPVTVSLQRVIPGWKEALQLMSEGSRWQLFIPSELAYGARGSTGIGPNSTLLFEVELLQVAVPQVTQANVAPAPKAPIH